MITNSIRFKTSVLYSSILFVILVGFSAYLHNAVKHILYQNLDKELRTEAEQIVGTINAYGEVSKGDLPAMSLMRQFLSTSKAAPAGQEAIDKLWEKHRWLLELHKDIFMIIDTEGQIVLQSENLPTGVPRPFMPVMSIHTNDIHQSDVALAGPLYRTMSYPFSFTNRRQFVLQLATPLEPVDRILSRLIMVMIGGILAILGISLFVGRFLTRKILAPVSEVTRTANNISQKNLGIRIPEKSLDLEMRMLVSSFNQMISRLEKSFRHINEFSAHVAHELKTPLAIIKGELELALADKGVREEDRQVMLVALQEVDRLTKIIKDLLLLAKFEYNLNIFKMERIDLVAFVRDVYQYCKVLASEKGVRLELLVLEEAIWVQADPVHLRRLFFNLVHNAVKFTPASGEIILLMERQEGHVLVSVKDNGEGMAPEDQARIFEQFYRIRRHDRPEIPGTGLGLCLARSIARGHGGDIVFTSEAGKGSTFTVILPI